MVAHRQKEAMEILTIYGDLARWGVDRISMLAQGGLIGQDDNTQDGGIKSVFEELRQHLEQGKPCTFPSPHASDLSSKQAPATSIAKRRGPGENIFDDWGASTYIEGRKNLELLQGLTIKIHSEVERLVGFVVSEPKPIHTAS